MALHEHRVHGHRAHVLSAKQRTSDVGEVSVDVSATDGSSSVSTFVGLLLSDPVLAGLTDAGYQRPSPVQQEAIPRGKCGLDLIVQAKSGTGKTCVLAVVALEQLLSVLPAAAASAGSVSMTTGCSLRCQSVVLAPTREVVLQVAAVIRAIGSRFQGLSVCTFIGGTPISSDIANCKLCHIAVASPGRMKHLIESGHLNTDSVRLFVMDEADKLMENTFIDDINYIYTKLPTDKQMLTLSATYTEQMAQYLSRYMLSPTFVRLNTQNQSLLGVRHFAVDAVVPSSPSTARDLSVAEQQQQKLMALHQLLSSVEFTQCLVFCNYQTRAETIALQLRRQLSWPAEHLSAALEQQVRGQLLERLQQLLVRVLVATDLAARGIDSQHVDLVVNWDVPAEAATLLHRAGRAGRYGSHAACVTLVAGAAEALRLRQLTVAARIQLYRLDRTAGKSGSLQLTDADLSEFGEYFSDDPVVCLPAGNVSAAVSASVGVSPAVASEPALTASVGSGSDCSAGDNQRGVAEAGISTPAWLPGLGRRRVLTAKRRAAVGLPAGRDLDTAEYQAASDGWSRAVNDRVTRSRDRFKTTACADELNNNTAEARSVECEGERYHQLLEEYRMEQLACDAREYSQRHAVDTQTCVIDKPPAVAGTGGSRSDDDSKPAGDKSDEATMLKNDASHVLCANDSSIYNQHASEHLENGTAPNLALSSCCNSANSSTGTGDVKVNGGNNCVANVENISAKHNLSSAETVEVHGSVDSQSLLDAPKTDLLDRKQISAILSRVRHLKCHQAESVETLSRYLCSILNSCDRSDLYSQCMERLETKGLLSAFSYVLSMKCESLSLQLLKEERSETARLPREGDLTGTSSPIVSNQPADIGRSGRVSADDGAGLTADVYRGRPVLENKSDMSSPSLLSSYSARSRSSPTASTTTYPSGKLTDGQSHGVPKSTGANRNSIVDHMNPTAFDSNFQLKSVRSGKADNVQFIPVSSGKAGNGQIKPVRSGKADNVQFIPVSSDKAGNGQLKPVRCGKADNSHRKSVVFDVADVDDTHIQRVERTEDDLLTFQLELRRSMAAKTQKSRLNAPSTDRRLVGCFGDGVSDDDDDLTNQIQGNAPARANYAVDSPKYPSKAKTSTRPSLSGAHHSEGIYDYTNSRPTAPRVIGHSEMPRASGVEPHPARYNSGWRSHASPSIYQGCTRGFIGGSCYGGAHISCSCFRTCSCCLDCVYPRHHMASSRVQACPAHCDADCYCGRPGARSSACEHGFSTRYRETCDPPNWGATDCLIQRCYREQSAYIYHMLSFNGFK